MVIDRGGFPIMHAYGYNRYRQTDVITADPKRLVLLCYEEAIRSLQLAKAKYEEEEFEKKGKAVRKALDLINELREALDFDRGGEIAKNLDGIYAFMTARILKADTTKEMEGFDQVAAMLEELRSAWEEAFYGRQEERSLPVSPPFSHASEGASFLVK
jgi:flagellar protein FliS